MTETNVVKRPWTHLISAADQEVYDAAGYGGAQGIGAHPALLVVDVTYRFTGPTRVPILEAIDECRTACGESAWAAMEHMVRLIDYARTHAIPVVYTKSPSTWSASSLGQWAVKSTRSTADLAKDQELSDINAEVAPTADDVVITKSKPSGFFGSDLTSALVARRIDSLIVVGGTTSGCIRATVLDAFSLNYRVTVVEDATFDRTDITHAMNLFDLQAKYADVCTTDAVLSQLSESAR